MKRSLALKTLLRSPGKTLFTFLLIAVLTFSLFIQLAEYQTTKREFEKNIDLYRGTGYVEKAPATFAGYKKLRYPYYIATDPRVAEADTGLPDFSGYDYPSLTADEVETLDGLDYISATHRRYMTAGRSAYPRLRDDIKLWDSNSLAIVEGTLQEFTYAWMLGDVYQRRNEDGISIEQAARLSQPKLLAGDLDLGWAQENGPVLSRILVREWLRSNALAEKAATLTLMEDGELYFYPCNWMPGELDFLKEGWIPAASKSDWNMYNFDVDTGWTVGNVILQNYTYGFDTQAQWKIGGRYVFVLRFTHENHGDVQYEVFSLNLYDWLSEHFCPAVWDVTDAPENYLELPEYAPLRELMEIMESDHNTQDVVYVGDMSAIRQIKDGKLTLQDGRWLTPEDTETGAKVCMLDEKFAQTYGLKVGDKLSLELGNELFEQFFNLGAVASTVERYSDTWIPDEFEIVGLYKTVGGAFIASKEPNWNYSVNTVFVPLSSLPETVDLTGHEYAPGEYTFRVDNAWDIAPFLKETAPQIEAMGLTLMFDDGGWMEVYKPYMEAQRIAMLRIVLLAAVTVMATAFVVYLFISRKRKDYAIMRALGTPKGLAGRSLLLPLLVLSAAGVIVGLTAAAVYIGRMDGLGQPSLGMALLCGGGELLLTLLLALVLLRGLSHQSVLALLQGGAAPKAAPRSPEIEPAPVAVAPAIVVGAGPRPALAPLRRRPRPVRFVLRYVCRHMRRSGVKSLLSVLVAALMLSAVAQMGYMREVYRQLRIDIAVIAKFDNSISIPKLKDLEADGLAADLYYEQALSAALVEGPHYYDVNIVSTNDINKYTEIPVEISYAPGYNWDNLNDTGKYVLVGVELMKEHGLSLGDQLQLSKQGDISGFYGQQMGMLHNEDPDMPISREVMFERYPERMYAALEEFCDCPTIIGIVTTGHTTYDSTIFTAHVSPDKNFRNDTQLDYVEFRIPDNSRAQEMKQRGEELTHNRPGAFSIDIEKLESVERTAALLETLYPIVIALALVIGAALCALLVMQTGKDAAIMRAQGTTKRMTRSMLAVEQIILGAIGALLGMLVMLAWKRGDFSAIAVQAGLFAGAYALILIFSSYISAAFATRKNILELLQTRE